MLNMMKGHITILSSKMRSEKKKNGDIPVWTGEILDKINCLIEGGRMSVEMSAKFEVLDLLLQDLEIGSFQFHSHSRKSAQEALLALWLIILSNLNNISVLHYKHTCYRLLIALMGHDIFLLRNAMTGEHFKSKDDQRLMNIYRQLVRDTFVHGNRLLEVSNSSIEMITYACRIMAITFFVFPAIQAPLIDTLSWKFLSYKVNFEQYQEDNQTHQHTLKEIEYDLESACFPKHECNKSVSEFMNENPDIFQWVNYLNESDNEFLNKDDTWRIMITTNGLLFCIFLREYITRLNKTANGIPSVWGSLPGYVKLTQVFVSMLYDAIRMICSKDIQSSEGESFFLEKLSGTQDTNTDKEPDHQHQDKSTSPIHEVQCSSDISLFEMDAKICDYVFDCASKFLSNSELLQIFVKVSLNAVDRQSATGVSRSLHCITKWALICSSSDPCLVEYINANSLSNTKRLSLQSANLSKNIDMVHMISKIETLLSSTCSAILVSVLTFLYNHLDGMKNDDRRVISLLLLEKFFFQFMLHWRFEVRCCFQHLLAYKLLRHDRRRLNIPSDRILISALQAANEAPSKEISFVRIYCNNTSDDINNGVRNDASNIPLVCENPQLILDQLLTSKIGVYIQMLWEHNRSNQHEFPFPESDDIFLDTALSEYSAILTSYYHYCEEVEASEGRKLTLNESIEGPELSAMLVRKSPLEH